MAELVDAPALGAGGFGAWGFESLRPHWSLTGILALSAQRDRAPANCGRRRHRQLRSNQEAHRRRAGNGQDLHLPTRARRLGGTGLALTFIRNLVRDLDKDLGDIANVYTFHRFCKYQLHKHPDIEGLQEGWDYYPPLFELTVEDLELLGRATEKKVVERALHTLDDSDGLISDVLRLGSYYNAVTHTDLVYRVLRYFGQDPDKIPEYPLIVVDEYQDFSALETSFIGLLATKSRVLIAGDDDQALYGFKSASPRFIRELAEDDGYENFELPYCSRCTEVIVAAVNDGLRAAIYNGNLVGRLRQAIRVLRAQEVRRQQGEPEDRSREVLGRAQQRSLRRALRLRAA